MKISEEKIKIVINNYFKTECSVDTTIREAFEKGFRLGIKKVKGQECQWIPVSERLPGKDGHYLVYAPKYRGGSSSAKEYYDGVMFSRFNNGKWSIEHGYYERKNCVIAWMPLPEPYKGAKA